MSHTIEGDHLTILLKDISRDVYVRLEYEADAGTGILQGAPLSAEQDFPLRSSWSLIASGTWNLPRGRLSLRYLTGRWAGEWNLHEQLIQPGKRF
jgi:alpha-galactosidase